MASSSAVSSGLNDLGGERLGVEWFNRFEFGILVIVIYLIFEFWDLEFNNINTPLHYHVTTLLLLSLFKGIHPLPFPPS